LVRSDQVGQPFRLAHLHRHHLQFVGQVRNQRYELGELAHQMRLQRVEFLAARDRIGQPLDAGREVRLLLQEVDQLDSRQSLHQHPHAQVRIAQHLEDSHRGSAGEEPVGFGILFLGVLLCGQPDNPLRRTHLLQQPQRGGARNQERMNLTGEDYDAAQGQHRDNFGNLDLAQVLFRLEALFPFGLFTHR